MGSVIVKRVFIWLALLLMCSGMVYGQKLGFSLGTSIFDSKSNSPNADYSDTYINLDVTALIGFSDMYSLLAGVNFSNFDSKYTDKTEDDETFSYRFIYPNFSETGFGISFGGSVKLADIGFISLHSGAMLGAKYLFGDNDGAKFKGTNIFLGAHAKVEFELFDFLSFYLQQNLVSVAYMFRKADDSSFEYSYFGFSSIMQFQPIVGIIFYF